MVETPALVFSEPTLVERAGRLQSAFGSLRTSLLYSIKALAATNALDCIKPFVHGFAASSLFEARLAREVGGATCAVQHVGTALRAEELSELGGLCDRITFNSVGQLHRFGQDLAATSEVGIRINPGVAFVADERYDPCRRNSKLGVPLDRFRDQLRTQARQFKCVSGVHFHTNCDSDDIGELIATVRHVESALGDQLHRFRWLNVGGGYSFADDRGIDQLKNEFGRLSDKYSLEIVIEPGAAIVRSAGCFVSSVADIVEGDDYPIAVLDLSVNHWPEVFEYQFEPDVEGHVDGGRYTYLLAGCSCLAGDLFGVYSFHEPLELGSRVVFPNAGAYSIVKAHMFNGINLPSIYALTEAGELALIKRFTYEDFLSRCGVDTRAAI